MSKLNSEALLKMLERYSAQIDGYGGVEYEKDADGMWVAYDDVEKLVRELIDEKRSMHDQPSSPSPD